MSKVDELLAWLVPRRCLLCNLPNPASALCPGCRDDMPWLGRACDSCGTALPDAHAGRICAGCSPRRGIVAVRAALAYEFPVDRMITGAKFHRQLHFARALGELFAWDLQRGAIAAPHPDVLVPVPLSQRRLAARGYNQALEIARPVAAMLGLALEPSACRRIRDTAEQTGLSANERRRNLRGAFAVGGCAGARVAVLDDVVTTGSTAAAVSAAFRDAGAASVEVWAVARAL
jgi:ComF family protein